MANWEDISASARDVMKALVVAEREAATTRAAQYDRVACCASTLGAARTCVSYRRSVWHRVCL